MMDLNTVVSTINEKGLRLIRTADSICIDGHCPPELAEAIKTHQASLLPFAAVAPSAVQAVAMEQAAADADNIRQQLDDFSRWIVKRHAWAVEEKYVQHRIDTEINPVVDRQQPSEVAAEISRQKATLDAIGWASHLFPLTMETEAKHAAESGAMSVNTDQSHDAVPL